MNCARSSRAASRSGKHSRKAGCPVATAKTSRSIIVGLPRTSAILTGLRINARAAVAPRESTTGGETIALAVEPPAAGFDFVCVRTLMNSTLAAKSVYEVLHRVGEKNGIAIDTGIAKCFVKDLARGPDERPARKILQITRLLADNH